MITMKPERRMPPSQARTSTCRRSRGVWRAREGGAVFALTAPPLVYVWWASALEPREGGPADELRRIAQLFLDPQKLIVFRDALASSGRAALDLTGVRGDDEVGDRGVLGLTRAVREHRGVARAVRHVDGVEGLRQRSDLVDLDQQRVGDAEVDALLQPDRVRHEQVVADQLRLLA